MKIKIRAMGKERPRSAGRSNGRSVFYTPTKTKRFENIIKNEWYLNGGDYYSGALEAEIIATFEPPKSTSQKKRTELIGTPYLKKPDGDNIVKAILDSLNEVAYDDDRFIYKHTCTKLYGEEDSIEIIIKKKK